MSRKATKKASAAKGMRGATARPNVTPVTSRKPARKATKPRAKGDDYRAANRERTARWRQGQTKASDATGEQLQAVGQVVTPPGAGNADTPPGPVRRALTEAIESSVLCGILGVMIAGNVVLELGSWTYLLGTGGWMDVSYGTAGSAAVIAGEVGVGHYLLKAWRSGRRDGLVWFFGALVLGFAGLEAVVAMLRETAAVHGEVAQAIQSGQTGPSLPPELIGHPQSIEAWTKAQAAAGDHKTTQLVAHARDRSPWETPALVLAAVLLSLATSACTTAFSDLVRSLLAIPAGILAEISALFRRREPAALPPAGEPAAAPSAAPVPAEPLLQRLARWPVVRMFTRPAAAGAA